MFMVHETMGDGLAMVGWLAVPRLANTLWLCCCDSTQTTHQPFTFPLLHTVTMLALYCLYWTCAAGTAGGARTAQAPTPAAQMATFTVDLAVTSRAAVQASHLPLTFCTFQDFP